jgi:hypothetical protein
VLEQLRRVAAGAGFRDDVIVKLLEAASVKSDEYIQKNIIGIRQGWIKQK